MSARRAETAPSEASIRLEDAAAAEVLAQQAAIAQIGQRALEERSLPVLLDEACSLVSSVLGAEYVSISELAPDRKSAKIIAGIGWRRGVVGELVLGAGAESQAGYTLAARQPIIVADYRTEERFKILPALVEHNARSGMSVRIGGVDAPYGTLAVFTAKHIRFTHDDANFLRAVANVLAAAIGRLAVERELRASRDQLAAIVDSIDEGITVRDKSGLIFANDEAAKLTGYASAGELISSSDSVLSQFELFDETGRPLSTDELPGRRAVGGDGQAEALVGFRVNASAETHWSVVRAVALREPDGELNSVISIFRDITQERYAQETREYMADAVAVLTSTLETNEAAQRLASLSVPRLADYVTVSMLQPDGSLKLVALAHIKPERIDIVRELERSLPPNDPGAEYGVAKVIREGTVERGTVTPEIIDALPLSAKQIELLHKLELREYVTVPLTGRVRAIGALSLAMAESGRSITPRDVELAVELGARAGIALENAQLFQTADTRREELDAVLAALDDPVLVFDGAGRLRLGNQAARRTFQGALPVSLDELLERSRTDQPLTDDKPLEVDVDGMGRWHELRRYKASSGTAETNGFRPTIVVMRDITEVRAARAARDAFMGVLSHELRTPITTIYGGSELLSRDLDDEHRAEVIADIRAESERLARLVEDLLVMTRVERDIVEIADEPILLQHLLASVISAAGARWPGAYISLQAADRLPAVRGDATYIEQVVRNLLTNAMRYGQGLDKGIEVLAEDAGDSVVVRVVDNGDGFGGEEPDRLFELFYRSSSARSVPGGAGIGLFVCRNLIEKMGGQIWARERAEGGAEFGFSLPVLDSDAAF
ncbi:MAG TPA: ATP-binding protein [Candidatus Limnocylindrales bacterium]